MTERGDMFVVVEDRGDAGAAVLVLVLADAKVPAEYEGLPTLAATFDAEQGCYRPGDPVRQPRRAARKKTEASAAAESDVAESDEPEVLKGAALDEALTEAGLSTSGTADARRARLAVRGRRVTQPRQETQ